MSSIVAERRNSFATVVMYQHDERRFQIVSYWRRPDAVRSPRLRRSRSFVDKPEPQARLAFAKKCAKFALRSPL